VSGEIITFLFLRTLTDSGLAKVEAICPKLRDMTNLQISQKVFFFTWTYGEFNFRKESIKNVSEIARFSGYSDFAGSPVFRKKFFLSFFQEP
jgi:hypothetical protein